MAWKSLLSHKLAIAYWAGSRDETYAVVLRDPPIRELSLFNPLLSADLRKNEMRIEAGAYLKHFVQLSLPPQPDGTPLSDAFDELVDLLSAGVEPISASGDLIDRCYLFLDEPGDGA